MNTHIPLTKLGDLIREALAKTAAADTESQAAEAFSQLQQYTESYIARASEMNREHWKLRDTAIRQAQTIALADLDEINSRVGEAAPPDTFISFQQPETVTVQQSPDFFFIRLSYGMLNIRHIVELDVKSKTLHTTQGTRHLSSEDTRTILFHTKLYAAK